MVSNIFYFHPYLGKIPILTNVFQMGCNHQLETLRTQILQLQVRKAEVIPFGSVKKSMEPGADFLCSFGGIQYHLCGGFGMLC